MIPHYRPQITAADMAYVTSALQARHLGDGHEVRQIEEELAEQAGTAAAAVVSNGTVALRLAAVYCFADPGDDPVTIPSYACSSLAHAVKGGGLWAQPRDVDASTFTLPPTKHSVTVHTFGMRAQVGESSIEDLTHCLGRLAGRVGIASFGATKLITGGQGGAVFGPRDMIEEIRNIRDYDGKRDWRPRFNWQLSDINAALIRSQLRALPRASASRERIAEYYQHMSPFPVHGAATVREWFRFVIRVPAAQQAAVIERFRQENVQAIIPIEPWELLHRQLRSHPPCFNAVQIAVTTVSIPCYADLQQWEMIRVGEALARMEDLCRVS